MASLARGHSGRRSGSAAAPAAGTWRGCAEAVTALYPAHAVGLIRLAVIILGDRAAAEDVVQEAFLGLYRHWGNLDDPARTLPYLRTTVLNGCRSALRRETRRDRRERVHGWRPDWNTAEYRVLLAEEHRATLAAIRRLPDRQREALRAPLLPRPARRPGGPGHGDQPRHRQVRHVPRARRARPDAAGGKSVIMKEDAVRMEEAARAAMRAAAGTVADAPPLHLPPLASPALQRPRRHEPGYRRRRAQWLVPLAAAACIIAIAAGLVVVRGQHAPTSPRPVPSSATSASAVPDYYVALSHPPDAATPNQVIVGNAATGHVLSRVSPPAGTTFAGVAGAADDRTFILETQPFP